MNRISFNIALENRLRDVYEEDKNDALNYYNELFDEMGLSDKDEIPNEYNDIDSIVKDIKKDMKMNSVIREGNKEKNSIWKNILIIIGAIFAIPIGGSIAAVVGSILLVLAIILITIVFVPLISGVFSIGALLFATIGYFTSTRIIPLGIIGGLLIAIGLTILFFKFAKFMVISIKNFVVRKLEERKMKKNEK